MKKYYFTNGDFQNGPVNFDELKNKITPQTYIWFEGLKEWTKAKEIEELQSLFPKPPPLPRGNMPLVQPPPIPFNQTTYYETKTNNFSEIQTNINNDGDTHESPKMFQNIFSAKGRIRRLEFWITGLVYSIIGVVVYLPLCVFAIEKESLSLMLVCLAVIGTIAYHFYVQAIKRCHDLGKSGWHLFNPLFQIKLYFVEGEKTDNEYGKSPK